MPSEKVAVLGTGVIGASWCAFFLARGYDVAAWDPAPGAAERLQSAVAQHWPVLQRMGAAHDASLSRLSFHKNLGEALQGAIFVQENGPEKADLKIALFQEAEAYLEKDVLIASSTSGLPISPIQAACRSGDRMIVGHPFNPPHLIPLVEICGGQHSREAALRAMEFYRSLGKSPILLEQEIPGHIANRLQAALWREAMSLVAAGHCSVNDIEQAVSDGIGLRWAFLGPFMNLELSGGTGGIGHNLRHMAPAIESWWQDLGQTRIDPPLIEQLAQQTSLLRKGRAVPEIEAARQAAIVELLSLKAVSSL